MAETEREAVYDEKIAPLMKQIIDICKAHKVPVVASFDLSDEEHEGFRCSTYTGVPRDEMPETFEEVIKLLYPPKPQLYAFTIFTEP